MPDGEPVMPVIDGKLMDTFRRQHYKVVGERGHAAAKVCHWTKAALTEDRMCYKHDFYGINSHQCLQMTPSLTCNFACEHCWRVHGTSLETHAPDAVDDPIRILDESLQSQRLDLTGFKGHKTVDMERWREANEMKHVAISLDGEPTQYPRLGEFIAECHRRGMTTFLVTNGSYPEVLEKLDPLPTQLYVSVYGPNKEIFTRTTHSLLSDGWERFNRTLDLLPSLDTRIVLRHTLTKDLNMGWEADYARMDLRADPDFVETKGYMFVGASRERLSMSNMPSHEEIKQFAANLAEHMGYDVRADIPQSRVCLLTRPGMEDTWIPALRERDRLKAEGKLPIPEVPSNRGLRDANGKVRLPVAKVA